MSSRIDDMLDGLVEAVVAETLPLRGDGADGLRARLRPALGEALRGIVVDQGGQEIDGTRLTSEACLADAERLYAEAGHTSGTIRVIAQLLRDVREADQRERWIREGYSADSRRAWAAAEDAERRNAELEHAIRLVKRATRDLRVGRE